MKVVARKRKPPVISVLMGPRRGKRYTLKKPSYMIGGGKLASIRFDGEFVSEEHLEVRNREDSTWVIENRSEHGTLVNGQRVETRVLQDGDKIQVGTGVVLLFSADESSAADSAKDTEIQSGFNTKTLLISVGLAGYLGAIAAVYFLFLAPSNEAVIDGLTPATIEQSITDSLTMIREGRIQVASSPPNSGSSRSSMYYRAVSSGLSEALSEDARSAFEDELRSTYYTALTQLKAGRRTAALETLKGVYAMAPDIRLPATALSMSVRAALREDGDG